MTGPAKRKGDAAEREICLLLHAHLHLPVRRKLGAGRQDDMGDLDGIPDCTAQVVSRATDVVAVGVVRKPVEAGEQAERAGTTHAVTFLRVRGGTWRAVLTLDQWAALYREATSP